MVYVLIGGFLIAFIYLIYNCKEAEGSIKIKENLTSDFQNLMGVSFYFDEVLNDSSYYQSLDKNFMIKSLGGLKESSMNLQDCARYFHPIFLHRLYEQDKVQFENLKECYQKAFNDGIIEAINNLAILDVNYEEDKVNEGIELFKKGINLGVEHCIINLINFYWGKREYEKAATLLNENSSIPYCAYKLAILYNSGYAISKKGKKKARQLLKSIIENEPYENEFNKYIAEEAHKLMESLK